MSVTGNWRNTFEFIAEIAIRISRALGGTPESWLRMQEALDLWAAEMKFKSNPDLAPIAIAALSSQ